MSIAIKAEMLTEAEIHEAIQTAYGEWTVAVEGRALCLAHNLVVLMTSHIIDKQNAKRMHLDNILIPRGLIRLCPKCSSGDVRWCNISHRPYCAECHHWGPVNHGSDQDAVDFWNKAVAFSMGTI